MAWMLLASQAGMIRGPDRTPPHITVGRSRLPGRPRRSRTRLQRAALLPLLQGVAHQRLQQEREVGADMEGSGGGGRRGI